MKRDVVLVTGGTGNIGNAFVALLAADVRAPIVRVVSRDPASPGARLSRKLHPENVQIAPFNVDDPASMGAALDGVTKLLVIAPFIADMGAWHEKVAAAAKEAKTLEYVVKVSVTGARAPGGDSPPGRIPLSHWQGEEALRKAGLAATMIRPNIFMQHFLTVPGLYTKGDDRFYLPTGAADVAWLDCRDIAAMAAGLLLASPEEREPYRDQAYELTGPRAHTASELAEILSLVARRSISHVDGADAFSVRCKELGTPDVVKNVYAEAAGGWFGKVDDAAFSRLLGRHTTSFAKFAIDHAATFGAGGGDG